jgi:arylsulfatase A-like enzyme
MGGGKAGARDRSAFLRRAIVCACVLTVAGAAVAFAGGGATDPEVAAAVTDPPNVMFIVTDDQRLDGTMVMMPQTRQWFETGGTYYPQMIATTPLCCPSRSSIFTGRYVHNTGVQTNQSATYLDPRNTLQRSLHDAGYFTGMFGKYLNEWSDLRDPPYIDRFSIFDSGYNSFRANEQGTLKQITQYSTNYLRDQALGFLQEAEANDNQPWFLYVAPYAPHLPAVPEAQYQNASIPPFTPNAATWEPDRSDKPPWVAFARLDQTATIASRDNMLRTLPSVDNMVEALMQDLEAKGETNTLAVFTSDNGYMWGEHNLEGKNRPYLDSVRVPMYVRWPGHVTAGATDNRLIANIDLTPTALAATGVSPGAEMDGHDILDNTWSRNRMLAEFDFQGDVPTWVSLLTPTSQYIETYRRDDRFSIAFREYYDLVNDPYQIDNLLADGNSANDPPVASLSAQIAEDRVCAGSNCP